MKFIDTHTHLDGEEFDTDRDLVMERAREAGVSKVFIPAIDLKSVKTVIDTCQHYPGYAYPMIGLDKLAQEKINFYFKQSRKYLEAISIEEDRKAELTAYAQRMMKREY